MNSRISDEGSLLFLLKAPKKKYLKKIIQMGITLNLSHNHLPNHYATPISQNFQSDLGLTLNQSHKLLLALSQLVNICLQINFQFDRYDIFSQEFDDQLKQLLISTMISMEGIIQEGKSNNLREGNKFIDMNWKLDMQIANQKGKSNTPLICVQLDTVEAGSAELQTDKFSVQGQKFQAFFANLKKIKQNLNDLVNKQ